MFELRPEQRTTVDKGLEILKRYNLLYLAAQVRTGKTFMSLTIAKEIGWKRLCFVTKKMAISSIQSDYFKLGHTFEKITVTNYEQVPKLHPEYDGFIIDEATTCFPAGTMVDGKNIEVLLLDDSLKSLNLEKNIIEERKITGTNISENKSGWVKVVVDGKSVVCTPDHLFFSKRGWIKAKDITNEDELFIMPETTDSTSGV